MWVSTFCVGFSLFVVQDKAAAVLARQICDHIKVFVVVFAFIPTPDQSAFAIPTGCTGQDESPSGILNRSCALLALAQARAM